MIGTARALAKEAAVQHVPITLATYPNDGHAFFTSGEDYDAAAATDSLHRAPEELAKYLKH
jgi:dienelactone hydrolase